MIVKFNFQTDATNETLDATNDDTEAPPDENVRIQFSLYQCLGGFVTIVGQQTASQVLTSVKSLMIQIRDEQHTTRGP